MMQFNLKIKNDKVIGEFSKIFQTLQDGEYNIKITPINTEKTIEEWREMYFAILSFIENKTGYKKNELHEMFKEYKNIKTTKGFSIADWTSFIESLKYYLYSELDIII